MAATDQPDLTEFLKLSRPKRPLCRVAPALEGLSPTERRQFDAACAQNAGLITNQALALWLERHCGERWQGQWQHALSHRDQKCSCHDG